MRSMRLRRTAEHGTGSSRGRSNPKFGLPGAPTPGPPPCCARGTDVPILPPNCASMPGNSSRRHRPTMGFSIDSSTSAPSSDEVLEALEVARKDHPGLPVIANTAATEVADLAACKRGRVGQYYAEAALHGHARSCDSATCRSGASCDTRWDGRGGRNCVVVS